MTAFSHGGLAHFDISGSDCDALGSFYKDVFGWDVESKGPGYAGIKTPDGSADGAIVESESNSLTIGVTVENLEEALARAETAGGSIAMPVTDNGWVKKAQIKDISGNLVTLIQM